MAVELKILVDDKGQEIVLGRRLGAGGEGAVYDVSNYKDIVVKLYHKTPPKEQIEKLRAMIQTGSERILKLSTWPVSLMFDGHGQPIGFLMPKLKPNYKEVIQLYSPANRKKSFPDADYSFIVHTAMNIAAAFDAIHEAGHVVGDVNQKNILVSDQALALLIDCDSFQIKDSGGHIYPCTVGVAEFTPPELQHKELRDELRTFDHDDFGLAVIVFELLFLGRHPFAGKYLGAGDPPSLEEAISGHMFPYTSSPKLSMQYVPPPFSVPIGIFPDQIMDLFNKAFDSSDGQRPDAEEWRIALKQFKDTLTVCSRDEQHKFPRSSARCTWCDFADHGTLYFGSTSLQLDRLTALATSAIVTEFDNIFNRIQPLTTIALPLPAVMGNQTLYGLRTAKYVGTPGTLEVLVVAMLIFFLLSLAASQYINCAFVAVGVMVVGYFGTKYRSITREFENQEYALSKRMDDLRGKLITQMKEPDILLVDSMKRKVEKYKALDRELKAKLDELEQNTAKAQMEEYLHRFSIEDCSELSRYDLHLLRSYSINTAADISRKRLYRLGSLRTRAIDGLLSWKEELIERFTPEPVRKVAPQVVYRLISSYKQRAHDLELEMNFHKQELASMENKYSNQDDKTIAELNEVRGKLARTKANLDLLKTM